MAAFRHRLRILRWCRAACVATGLAIVAGFPLLPLMLQLQHARAEAEATAQVARDEVRAAFAEQIARFDRAVGNLRAQDLTNDSPSLAARLLRAEPIVAPAIGLSVLNARGVTIASSTPSLGLGAVPPWLPRALETSSGVSFFVCADPTCARGDWYLVRRFEDGQARLLGLAFTTLPAETVQRLLTPLSAPGAPQLRQSGASGRIAVDWSPEAPPVAAAISVEPGRATAEIANLQWSANVPAKLGVGALAVSLLALGLSLAALALLGWPSGATPETDALRHQLGALAEERDRVLAAIGHDVRTPINSVLGICALLAEGDLDEAQRSWIRRIRASCETLLAMLNGILEIAAMPIDGVELHIEPVDVASLVQEVGEVLRPQAEDKGLELRITVEDSLLGLWHTDQTRLRQVLLNLVGNAIKYTVQGTVTLAGLAVEAGGRAEILIRVSDTGPGVTESERELIFEQFRRGRADVSRGQEGLGLGLALCREIATLLRGTIVVESPAGAGSTFTFRIPGDRVRGEHAGAAPLAGRNALVVGLSEGLRRRVAGHLERLGFEVETTADGFMAIGAAERAIFQHGALDVLITDGDLAGLSSDALIRRLRANPSLARVKIALVSNDGRHAAKPLADLVLAHPVEASDLDRAMAALFGTGTALHDLSPFAPASPRYRVLVVEDNHVNRMLYLSLLNRANFSAFAAASGEDAITAAQRGGFDVILMDVQMPGIDGIETTGRIRAMPGQADVPIIGLTAHSGPAIRAQCLAVGMNLVLQKPVDPSKLHLRLLEVLKGASPAATEPAADGAATIDIADEALEVLIVELGVERARACLGSFVQDTERHVEMLAEAVTRGEWDPLAELAHSLAGASSALGAAVLADALLVLEDGARAADRAQSEAALAELLAVWARTRPALRARFEALAGRRGGKLRDAA